jgi:hypothetical protein
MALQTLGRQPRAVALRIGWQTALKLRFDPLRKRSVQRSSRDDVDFSGGALSNLGYRDQTPDEHDDKGGPAQVAVSRQYEP